MATLKPRPEFAASDEDIAEITRRIDQADSVVVMCGGGCRGAADQLRALSDRLMAPLIHSVKGKDIMPYDDPRWMGGIGMVGTKAVYNAVMGCDLLLMVGTDYPYSNFLPSKGTVIQIDERPQVLGRRAPTLLGVTGSARPTLKLLLDEVSFQDQHPLLGQGYSGASEVRYYGATATRSLTAARLSLPHGRNSHGHDASFKATGATVVRVRMFGITAA